MGGGGGGMIFLNFVYFIFFTPPPHHERFSWSHGENSHGHHVVSHGLFVAAGSSCINLVTSRNDFQDFQNFHFLTKSKIKPSDRSKVCVT